LCRRDQVHIMRREKRTQKLSCHARRRLSGKKLKNPFDPNRQNISPRSILATRTAIFTSFQPSNRE
jgi:hypothetical protein